MTISVVEPLKPFPFSSKIAYLENRRNDEAERLYLLSCMYEFNEITIWRYYHFIRSFNVKHWRNHHAFMDLTALYLSDNIRIHRYHEEMKAIGMFGPFSPENIQTSISTELSRLCRSPY